MRAEYTVREVSPGVHEHRLSRVYVPPPVPSSSPPPTAADPWWRCEACGADEWYGLWHVCAAGARLRSFHS